MPETTVTAVIPCFNHGRYVRQAVDSLLRQTYPDLRVIIVNDGSTDPETLRVLSAVSEPRVEVLHQENGHVSAARNAGIKASCSPYLVTLDADDYFEPTFVDKALAVLKEDLTVGAVTCGVRVFGERCGTHVPTGGGVREFLVRNCARASAMFRRQCWEDGGGYNEAMRRGYEDWDFWIRLTARGWRIRAVPEILLNYRRSSHSMVSAADAIRPELVRELAVNHLPLYREHVADVLYGKECQIQSLEKRLDQLRGSLAYRIGRCVIAPFAALRDLARKAMRASASDIF